MQARARSSSRACSRLLRVSPAAASNSVVNATKQFAISYTGVPAANLMAGTYSDTLTFTITAN